MKFTKDEIYEIKDALEDCRKYYKDLLDVSKDLDPEAAKMKIEYACSKLKILNQ